MHQTLMVIALFSIASLTTACAQTAPPAKPAYTSDPKFVAALTDAQKLERGREYAFAIDSYKKANKISGGICESCLQKIFKLQLGIGDYRGALEAADALGKLAQTPTARGVAEADRASVLLAKAGEKAKPEQLAAVHEAYQQAIQDTPHNNGYRFQDACVLARMGKNDDASKEFAECADSAPANDPMRARAMHFAENPELSTHKMAPAFEVTALDGTHFNLDNMNGKVVLIDFWATWCGPCNAELPHMKKIAKEFAGQPLVIISISWDSDAQKWKEFIAKNEMTWLQYRDADHSLSNRFGISAIPHYFTIDSDGVLTAEMLGTGSDVEGKLKKLVKRARESQPPAAPAVAAHHTQGKDESLPANQLK